MSGHPHLCSACSAEAYQEFAHQCVHEGIAKNEAWESHYGGFHMPRWDFSHLDSTLSFHSNKKSELISDVYIAGSTLHGRWQWAWANQSADERSRIACTPILHFGEAKGWEPLTSPFVNADLHTGWECVSVASHLTNGQACYRFPYGNDNEFMAYLVILKTQRVN